MKRLTAKELKKRLRTRSWNTIVCHFWQLGKKVSVAKLRKMSDKEILQMDGIGKDGLKELRNILST